MSRLALIFSFTLSEATLSEWFLANPRNQWPAHGGLHKGRSHSNADHQGQCASGYPAMLTRQNRSHLRQDISEQRHNLNCVNSDEVRNTQVAANDAPVHERKPRASIGNSNCVRTARQHISANGVTGQENNDAI